MRHGCSFKSGVLALERSTGPLQGGEHVCGQPWVVLLGEEERPALRVQPVGGDVRQRRDPCQQRLPELGGVGGAGLQAGGPQQVGQPASLKEPLRDADHVVQLCAGSATGRSQQSDYRRGGAVTSPRLHGDLASPPR